MGGIKFPACLFIFALLAGLILLYKAFDPAGSAFFPKCLFLELTGWQCPGCGSQRAVHALLNADIAGAIRSNALLVLSIPYLIGGMAIEQIKNPGESLQRWRKRLYGKNAILTVLTLIIAFWILRNVF